MGGVEQGIVKQRNKDKSNKSLGTRSCSSPGLMLDGMNYILGV